MMFFINCDIGDSNTDVSKKIREKVAKNRQEKRQNPTLFAVMTSKSWNTMDIMCLIAVYRNALFYRWQH